VTLAQERADLRLRHGHRAAPARLADFAGVAGLADIPDRHEDGQGAFRRKKSCSSDPGGVGAVLPVGWPALIEDTLPRQLFGSTEALGELYDLLAKPRTAGVFVISAVPD